MNLDQAILLTKSWCEEAHESFAKVEISPNGDFGGILGAPDVIYSTQNKRLSIEGLIIDDASIMIEYPELFADIETVGKHEPYTLGEGYFFIEKMPMGQKEPQLTLRKDFTDGSITPSQFVKEVRWLMEWSTHWRLQRSLIVINKPEAQLIEEAPTIEAWARKNRPRPW